VVYQLLARVRDDASGEQQAIGSQPFMGPAASCPGAARKPVVSRVWALIRRRVGAPGGVGLPNEAGSPSSTSKWTVVIEPAGLTSATPSNRWSVV
jgi:hypothetical protein